MNKNILEESNIENLTNLFKLMGYEKQNNSLYKSNSWPNKLWSDYNYNKSNIESLIKIALDEKNMYTLPIWDKNDGTFKSSIKTLENKGFKLSFEQIVMVLDLKSAELTKSNELEIKYINSKEDIAKWVDVASNAFNYKISLKVIEQISNNKNIKLLLAYKDNNTVGTALLFNDSNVMGVHLVGVLNGNRGAGIGKSIMLEAIHYSKIQNLKYMTLQASTLGLGIYKRLGFKEQFILKNFVRKEN